MRAERSVLALVLLGCGWVGGEELIIAARVGDAVRVDPLTAAVRVLGGDEAPQEQRSESLRAIARATDQAGDKVVRHLDEQSYRDWVVRRGALRSVQALGIAGPRVSSALAWAAVRDGEARVRDEAVSIIKTRGDWVATELLGKHLMDTFDRQGLVIKADVHDQAVKALRGIGDRRVAEALASYVILEVRASTTQLNDMRVRSMRTVRAQGDGGSVNLPIELPSIGVTKYRGTVAVPAVAALRSLTGQDFGDDQAQWQRWVRSHPVDDWR